MDDASHGTPGHGPGRFHFDPSYDISVVPDLQTIRTWLERRADDADCVIAKAMSPALVALAQARGLRTRMTVLLLPGRRSREEAADRRACLDAAMEWLFETHEIMREYGVNLLVHPSLSNLVESGAAMSIIGLVETRGKAFLDEARRRRPNDKQLDRLESDLATIRTDVRMGAFAQSMRTTLELEALANLINGGDETFSRGRRIAALRALVDEIHGEEVRAVVADLLQKLSPAR